MDHPTPPRSDYTIGQYLACEESADSRHEFWDGRVIPKPVETEAHDKISLRIWRLLSDGLPQDCEPFALDTRVRTDRDGFNYPDVVVSQGPPLCDPPGSDLNIANPRIIFEVLSASSQVPDRSDRFRRYIAMESLQEYVLVAQDVARIEVFFRGPEGHWLLTRPIEGLDGVFKCRSVEVELRLADIYAGIDFPPPPPDRFGDPVPDPARTYTTDEYPEFEMSAEWQFDLRAGKITPKVHPGPDHMTIGTNLICEIRNRFDGTAHESWLGSIRVLGDVRRCFLHPDLSMTEEGTEFLPPKDNISLLNPIAVIEIYSAETAADDHGEKFDQYKRIESLREYILIAEDRPRVESFHRKPDGYWTSGETVEGLNGIWKSKSLGIELLLADVYADVQFAGILASLV